MLQAGWERRDAVDVENLVNFQRRFAGSAESKPGAL